MGSTALLWQQKSDCHSDHVIKIFKKVLEFWRSNAGEQVGVKHEKPILE